MTSATETAIRAILTTDSTVDTKDAKAALAVLKGESPLNVEPTDEGDKIISRKQVAIRIGKCVGSVDIYGRRGVIKRVYLPVCNGKIRRCQGYSLRSVDEAIAKGMIADYTGAAQGDGE